VRPQTIHLQARQGGPSLRLAALGGTVLSLELPDRSGMLTDVTPGFDQLDDYLEPGPYFGALIGRYANRIAGGVFQLDGKEYKLATNEGPNHLHGGGRGFDKVIWQLERFRNETGSGVVLNYVSPAGEEGYPGRLEVQVICTLTSADVLCFDYHATTDAPTPVNLTQHTYFNLAGHAAGDIAQHELTIEAQQFLPVDAFLIPTGELRSVACTPFDFRVPKRIGSDIDAADEQLAQARGYDHTFVLDALARGESLHFAARLHEPVSGRTLEVYTSEPGLHVYSANSLTVTGKQGCTYAPRCALALETQHFPDSPNQPSFPATVLRPGETFRSRTEYRFAVR
jgi:aldose 1-epimerase